MVAMCLICGCYVVAKFLYYTPSGLIAIHLVLSGPNGICMDQLGLIGINWDILGSFGIHLDPFESI